MAAPNIVLSMEQFEELVRRVASQQPTTRPSNIQLKEPSEFDGKTIHASNFLLECKLYIDANEHQFPTDETKIRFVLSYCKTGAAANFREHIVRSAETQVKVKEGEPVRYQGFGTWLAFKEGFEKAFITSNAKGEAIRDLNNLKMTMGIDAYIQEFQMLCTKAELDNFTAAEQYFIRGLPQRVQAKVQVQPQLPKTMIEWFTLVQNLEHTYEQFQNITQGGSYNAVPRERPTKVQQDVPMEIDAVRISKEEREKRFRNGECLYCGTPGHIARECRKQQRERAGKPKPNNNPYRATSNNPFRNGGSKKAQIKHLFKQLSTEERNAMIKELQENNPAAKIRELLADLPSDEKEEKTDFI